MKRGIVLICLLLVIFINLASAKNITVSYPDKVYYGKTFNGEIELVDFPESVYDIKIDILGDGKRIAKIWNGNSWQSTYNYVNDVIDSSGANKESFLLNITEIFDGMASMEIKVRNSATSTFSGYELEINYENQSQNNNQNNENNNQNTSNTSNNQSTQNTKKIYLELNYDDEDLVNGDEFEVEVKAFNLENDDYDIKIFIADENDKIISENYNEQENKWRSGNYYLDGILSGKGNKTGKIKLRVSLDHKNFSGDVILGAKIRKSGTSTIINGSEEDIEILKKESGQVIEVQKGSGEEKEIQETITLQQTGNVIRLGKRETAMKEKEAGKGQVLYESSTELIKKYGIYAFCLLLLVIILILLFKLRKHNV